MERPTAKQLVYNSVTKRPNLGSILVDHANFAREIPTAKQLVYNSVTRPLNLGSILVDYVNFTAEQLVSKSTAVWPDG